MLSPIAQLRNTDPKVQIELACQIWPTCYGCILFQGFPKKWHDRTTNMPSLANLLERCANDVRNWHPQRRPPLVQVRPHNRPKEAVGKKNPFASKSSAMTPYGIMLDVATGPLTATAEMYATPTTDFHSCKLQFWLKQPCTVGAHSDEALLSAGALAASQCQVSMSVGAASEPAV